MTNCDLFHTVDDVIWCYSGLRLYQRAQIIQEHNSKRVFKMPKRFSRIPTNAVRNRTLSQDVCKDSTRSTSMENLKPSNTFANRSELPRPALLCCPLKSHSDKLIHVIARNRTTFQLTHPGPSADHHDDLSLPRPTATNNRTTHTALTPPMQQKQSWRQKSEAQRGEK